MSIFKEKNALRQHVAEDLQRQRQEQQQTVVLMVDAPFAKGVVFGDVRKPEKQLLPVVHVVGAVVIERQQPVVAVLFVQITHDAFVSHLRNDLLDRLFFANRYLRNKLLSKKVYPFGAVKNLLHIILLLFTVFSLPCARKILANSMHI